MKLNKIVVNSILIICVISLSAFAVRAQSDSLKSLKDQVTTLLDQDKYLEALPVLEKIIALDPKDAQSHFFYGFVLFAKAKNTKDKNEVPQIYINARKAFIKAKNLGLQEKSLDAFIESIPEDGIIAGQFSKNIEAEDTMNEAESAFTKGKIDEALALYQKALKLDPTIYQAALFSGDMYMRKDDFANAEVWYQKAISINPNIETAYRYSATPLMKQKKYDQARDRYIEAYIVEPFNRFSAIGLGQWAEATGNTLGHPRIDIPASVGKSENGNNKITLGVGDKTDDGSFAWTMYGLSRAAWQSGKTGLSDKFKGTYPKETVYRHSLAEEFEALKMVVITLKARMSEKDNPVKKLHPQLEMLIKIYDSGLLEPYILLANADEGIAQDYEKYLANNREKLRQYVLKYAIIAGN
jgi:tetratricopeptide (TPR) repeat protein